MHTRADVHYQRTDAVDAVRRTTLAAARRAHPERFAPDQALPKILYLPETVWINEPPEDHGAQTLAV